MEIKSQLIELKNKLLGTMNKKNSAIKEVILEEFPIAIGDIYRLHYIKYYTFGKKYGYSIQELINWPCEAFYLPKGMKKEDAFKVISYLTDRVEEIESIEQASLKSVCKTDELLELEELGFTRAKRPSDDESVISLFTIDGDFEKFKESKHYPRYFEWYTPNVSKEEVERIYSLCGIKFNDLQFDQKGQVMKFAKIRNTRVTKPN